MFVSDFSLTHSDSLVVQIHSRSFLHAWVSSSSPVLTAEKEEEEEGGEGEITFTTGRSDYICIIHGMEINSQCIYRFLITSALQCNEYAKRLGGATDWLSPKLSLLLVKLNLVEQGAR